MKTGPNITNNRQICDEKYLTLFNRRLTKVKCFIENPITIKYRWYVYITRPGISQRLIKKEKKNSQLSECARTLARRELKM